MTQLSSNQSPMASQSVERHVPTSTRRGHGVWRAFWAGLTQSLRYWPIYLVFYIALVLVAGLLLLPLEQALVEWIGYRLAANELADGLDGWLLAEAIWQLPEQTGLPLLILTIPAWPFLFALPFTVLSGGALALYATDPPRTDWRRFGRNVLRYALSFVAMLLLEVLLLEVAVVVSLLIVVLAYLLTGSIVAALLPTVILAALLILIPWWFEYARVIAAVEQQRHILRVLGRSASFLRRSFNPAAGLALLSFLLGLLPYLLQYPLGLILPPTWWPGEIVLQQLFILAIVGTRLARLAGQVRLVQSRREVFIRTEELAHA